METLEYIMVGFIVFGCAVFSIWRLLSARLRLKALEALLSILPAGADGGLVAALRRRTLSKLSAGCGNCAHAAQTLNAGVRPLNRRSGAPRR